MIYKSVSISSSIQSKHLHPTMLHRPDPPSIPSPRSQFERNRRGGRGGRGAVVGMKPKSGNGWLVFYIYPFPCIRFGSTNRQKFLNARSHGATKISPSHKPPLPPPPPPQFKGRYLRLCVCLCFCSEQGNRLFNQTSFHLFLFFVSLI